MRRRRHSEGKDWPKRKLEAGNSLKLFAISIIEFLQQQRRQRSQAQNSNTVLLISALTFQLISIGSRATAWFSSVCSAQLNLELHQVSRTTTMHVSDPCSQISIFMRPQEQCHHVCPISLFSNFHLHEISRTTTILHVSDLSFVDFP